MFSSTCRASTAVTSRRAASVAVVGQQQFRLVVSSATTGFAPAGSRPHAGARSHRRLQRSIKIMVAAAAEADDIGSSPPPPLFGVPPAAARAVSQTAPQKGSLFGAIALITGSTVGAGMLALPAVSAPAGIVPTSLSLTAMWVLLTLDALLIAEVNLAARAARTAAAGGSGSESAASRDSIVTLRQMAEFSLGKAGKAITLVYLMLAYSLLTAYTTKAAEVLDFFAGGGLPPLGAAAAFVGAIGGLLYLGGTKAADSLNQGLTLVLLVLFGVILTAGTSGSSLPGSLLQGHADWAALEPAVPIIFLALVYHDLVPVIVSYLGGDRKTIRSAIVLGSLVPLTMFLSWEAVALSMLPAGLSDASSASSMLQASLQLVADTTAAAGSGAAGAAASQVAGAATAAAAGAGGSSMPVALLADGPGVLAIDPLEVFVRRSSPLIGSVVEGFSLLAVLTSFIGITLSTSETLRTEVPPLLREASKQLRSATGADSAADVAAHELSEADELACLASNGSSSELCGVYGTGQGAGEWWRFGGDQHGLALLLTLCPPLVLAASNPDSFLGALQIAGGYFMTLLYGVLPPLMAWQLRDKLRLRQDQHPEGGAGLVVAGRSQQAEQKLSGQLLLSAKQQPALLGLQEQPQQQEQQPWWRQQQHEEMVPGGVPMLAGLFSVAMVIEVRRLASDASRLASGGDASTFLQGLIEAALLNPYMPEAVVSLLQASTHQAASVL